MPILPAISTGQTKHLAVCLMALMLTAPFGPVSAENEPLSEYLQLQQDEDSTSEELRETLTRSLQSIQSQGSAKDVARALTDLPYWATTDTPATVNSLFDAAQKGEISDDLAKRAARRADGQLDSILRGTPPLDAYKQLTALEQSGVNYPLSYILLLRLYRVSAIEQALMGVRGADIASPVSVWRDATLSGDLPAATQEAIEVLDSLIAEYDKPLYADGRERLFLNDLRHRSALLRFLAGREDWVEPLQDIANASGDIKLWYDPQAVLDHIYVDQFFALSDSELRTDPSSGVSVVNTGAKAAATIPNLRVRRNYNPLQLSVWTCETLSQANENDRSILDVLNRLAEFQNADYRIIVGHHDGQKGRFSGRSAEDLKKQAESVLQSLPSELTESQSGFAATIAALRDDPICGGIVEGYPMGPVAVVEGAVDKGNEYYALGGMLDADQAQRIEDALMRSVGKGGFEDGGPYLLRPGTNG